MTTWTTRPLLYSSGHRVQRQTRRLTRAAFFMAGASSPKKMEVFMQFFASAVQTLQTLVVALGAGLGVWGVVNLLEGYGSDNPGSNAHVR